MKKIVVVLTALVAVSCAGSDDAVKKSIANINEELVVIQKSITDSQMGIEDVKAVSASDHADIAANMDAIAEIKSEIAYLNNELMLLKSKSASDKVSAVKDNGTMGMMDNLSATPTVIIDDTLPSDDQQIIIIEDSSAAKNSVYSYAIELNRQRKYAEAREKFEEFLQKYPKDELAGNAQYWIGETYYSTDELEPALAAFKDVLAKYSKSNKVADATLKIGYVYDKQGERQKAVSSLQDVVRKYPKTRPATLAAQKLKSWGIK